MTRFWGTDGGLEEFNDANGIAVDGAGNVYVADTRDYRIRKFTTYGAPLQTWGSQGPGDGQFGFVHGICATSDGKVFVADTSYDRVQVFTSDGDFLYAWGRTGCNEGEFTEPQGIAVDGDGNVYVADSREHRIQKFMGGFRVSAMESAGGTPRLGWSSEPGMRYSVWASPDLAGWTRISGYMEAPPASPFEWSDMGDHALGPPSAADCRFYQVRCSW